MLGIQDIGLSIMGESPKNFYILGGVEYGIKDKYLEILVSKIGPKIEYPTVMDVISLMSKDHLIPLQPQVYVVRYDKAFVNQAKDLVDRVLSLNIVGTLVLIYEDEKDLAKLDKLFPENTASIDPIHVSHLIKYLKSDFPKLDERTIKAVAAYVGNYYKAKNICRCLDALNGKVVLSEQQIVALFDIQANYSNQDIQVAIASRNFNSLVFIAEHYDGDRQNILYQILRVMIELDKIHSSKYSNSPLKQYAKKWAAPDIYYMFNHTYEAIKALRSGYTVDVLDLITYLGALMVFKNIPETRLLQ